MRTSQRSASVPKEPGKLADSYNLPANPSARPGTPLPKQNKGRLFVSFCFLLAVSAAGYVIYSSCLRYKCYGLVQGRLITVSAPWTGSVNFWQVSEGSHVQQGDTLARLENLELRHTLESLQGELKLTQAQIESEASRIQLQASDFANRHRQAQAEYLQTQGELLSEKVRLDEMRTRLVRLQKLNKSGSASGQELQTLAAQISGLDKRISLMDDSVEMLRLRAESTSMEPDDTQQTMLKPLLAKLDQTTAEINRLQQRIQQGSIAAPVSGTVITRHALTGETLSAASPVVELLESNSLEIVLYVPAKFADDFAEGQELNVVIDPGNNLVRCRVRRVGEQMLSAPEPLYDAYIRNQSLLPVYLTPLPGYGQLVNFRVNATVKVPYAWDDWLSDQYQAVEVWFHNQFTNSGNTP